MSKIFKHLKLRTNNFSRTKISYKTSFLFKRTKTESQDSSQPTIFQGTLQYQMNLKKSPQCLDHYLRTWNQWFLITRKISGRLKPWSLKILVKSIIINYLIFKSRTLCRTGRAHQGWANLKRYLDLLLGLKILSKTEGGINGPHRFRKIGEALGWICKMSRGEELLLKNHSSITIMMTYSNLKGKLLDKISNQSINKIM
jgi:hypothetical protein